VEEKHFGRTAEPMSRTDCRIYLLVEGQTEEAFVRELLEPHYARMGRYITPILVRTSAGHKGGVVSYAKIRPQIVRLCKQQHKAWVSTLFDLYALPSDFPGKTDAGYPSQDAGAQKADYLESRLSQDINKPNFVPNLMVHEFEALLFAGSQHFDEWANNTPVSKQLAAALTSCGPEDVNDNPLTAPSKRVLKAMPEYQKTFHGPLIACAIGLDAMRLACPHFNAWLSRLESLAPKA
jgi:hypothetical protein